MTLRGFEVDETPHNMDGLLLHAWDGSERVEAFISRRVMDPGSGCHSNRVHCPQRRRSDCARRARRRVVQ
jgi:hypothetical protein